MALRGQASVEFFVIAAFMLIITVALVSTAQENLEQAQGLQRATAARVALDSVTGAANSVFMQGDGARLTQTVFFPTGSVCLVIAKDARGTFLTCDAGPRVEKRIGSTNLLTENLRIADSCPPKNTESGIWVNVIASNEEGTVFIDCEAS